MTQARSIANLHYQTALAGQDGARRKFEPRYVETTLPAHVAAHVNPYMVHQLNPRANGTRPLSGTRPINGVQPYFPHPNTTPRPKGRSRPEEIKRKALGSSFPFNQCTDPTLRETKKSLEQGVKSAVHHYSNYQFQMFRLNYNSLFHNEELPLAAPDPFHWDLEQCDLPSLNLRELLALPPILVRNTVSDPDRNRLITLLKTVLHVCIQKKLRLSEVHMADPMVQQSLHYATNLFLQGFKSASTKGLCDDIIRDNHSGELNDALSDLVGDFLDKFEELALDSYEDVLMEGVTKALVVLDAGTVDNPHFFEEFRNVWKLDPANFLDFDVRVFIDEFTGGNNRPYSYNSFRESFVVKLGEVGLMMNILKAAFNYRGELLRTKPPEAIQQDIIDMPEFSQLQQSLLNILETAAETAPVKPKVKSLRFADA